MSDLQILCLIGGSALLLIISIVLIIVLKRKNKLKENKEYPELLEALGGSSNILGISINGSRISINFIDKQNINKEQIKQNGVEKLVVSNKKITLVIGQEAPIIYKYLDENIKA